VTTIIIGVLFWMGIIASVREWYLGRRCKPPVTKPPLWLLGVALLVALGVRLTVDLGGASRMAVARSFQWSLALALNGWALWRVVSRAAAEPSRQTIIEQTRR
jgi:hypothetical protein